METQPQLDGCSSQKWRQCRQQERGFPATNLWVLCLIHKTRSCDVISGLACKSPFGWPGHLYQGLFLPEGGAQAAQELRLNEEDWCLEVKGFPGEAAQADHYCGLNSQPGPSWVLVSLGLPWSLLLARGLRMECSGASRCVTNATNACSVMSEDRLAPGQMQR